ncbi:MAG: hypothetical protein QOE93_1819, partial [Actinomycetota bacterium]|nr:hypothetical protein [Actinomycetota bacterium]
VLEAALLCLLGTASGCSKWSDGASVRATTTTEAPVAIVFSVTSFTMEVAAPPVAGAVEGAQAGVLTTLQKWLEEDVVPSLRSAQPAPDLRPLFTAPTGEHVATTADRAAFVTEGLPPVTGLKADTASLDIVGLADPEGNVPIATVHVQLNLRGTADGTPLTVEHTGDLVLVPEADGWKIDSYDIRATRETPSGAVTTVAHA